MENNFPCIDKIIRYGLHNFDFSNPITLEKSERYVLTVTVVN
jgi:hypothetical protein